MLLLVDHPGEVLFVERSVIVDCRGKSGVGR